MRIYLLQLFTTVLFLFLIGCKKENVNVEPLIKPIAEEVTCDSYEVLPSYSNDTIFPSDYLMMYPGSYWEYSDTTTVSCTGWEEYLVRTISESGTCVLNEDKLILPVTNGGTHYMFESTVGNPSEISPSNILRIVSENPGIIYYSSIFYPDDVNHEYGYTILKMTSSYGVLDSIELAGTMYFDVIHTEYIYQSTSQHWGPTPPLKVNNYYAKYIGKVFEKAQGIAYGIDQEKYLVNYHIEPY